MTTLEDLDPDELSERLTPAEQLQIILDDLLAALNDARTWLTEATAETDAARHRVIFLSSQAQHYRVAIATLTDLHRDLAAEITYGDEDDQ